MAGKFEHSLVARWIAKSDREERQRRRREKRLLRRLAKRQAGRAEKEAAT